MSTNSNPGQMNDESRELDLEETLAAAVRRRDEREAGEALKLVASMVEGQQTGEGTLDTSNGFRVTPMQELPVGCNPFHYDSFHTGVQLRAAKAGWGDANLTWLTVFEHYSRREPGGRYVILFDHETGQRLRVELPPLPQKPASVKE